jgi:hypothetical protein
MKYRELTDQDLWQALEHLGNLTPQDLITEGEEFLNPRDLIHTLGVGAPRKVKDPIKFLTQTDPDYDWQGLDDNPVPPVVVVDGVLADGFHRCRLAAALGLEVKAVVYRLNRG